MNVERLFRVQEGQKIPPYRVGHLFEWPTTIVARFKRTRATTYMAASVVRVMKQGSKDTRQTALEAPKAIFILVSKISSTTDS